MHSDQCGENDPITYMIPDLNWQVLVHCLIITSEGLKQMHTAASSYIC